MRYVSGIYDKVTFLLLQRLILAFIPSHAILSNPTPAYSKECSFIHITPEDSTSNTNPNMRRMQISVGFNTTIIHVILIHRQTL